MHAFEWAEGFAEFQLRLVCWKHGHDSRCPWNTLVSEEEIADAFVGQSLEGLPPRLPSESCKNVGTACQISDSCSLCTARLQSLRKLLARGNWRGAGRMQETNIKLMSDLTNVNFHTEVQ
jgi:hypothetical protein